MNNYIKIIIILFLILLAIFNRSPIRSSSLANNIIVSPCDGTVTYANKNNITVFLSPLDVHVQYTPIDSYISDIKLINKNNFKLATQIKSAHNEGVRVVFKSKLGDIIVTQRVGFFVRRIINNIKINDYKKRSSKYGFITFGSRCDIELPKNLNTVLKKGDYVKGGETRII